MVDQQTVDQEAELKRIQQGVIHSQLKETNVVGDSGVTGLDFHYANEREGLKLDLACGGVPRRGYVGVDLYTADELKESNGDKINTVEEYVQHDLFKTPWPFEDNSVAAAYSSHFVEHIPHYIPGTDPKVDGWWQFFAELYRVMEPDGIVEVVHPFSRSDRAFWDPTHTRYIHFQTWFYLQRNQRELFGVNHYAPDIDFEVLTVQTIHEPALLEGKAPQAMEYARQFYWNVTDDLFVVMRAKK